MSPKAWSALILLQSVAIAAWFLFISGVVGFVETELYRGMLNGKPLPLITEWICSIHHFENANRLYSVCLFLATTHWLMGTLLVCLPRRPDMALPRWLFFSTCSWGILFVYFAFLLVVLLLPFVTILQSLTAATPEWIAAEERKRLVGDACLAGAVLYALAAMSIVYFRLRTRRTTQSSGRSSADTPNENKPS